MNKAIKTINDVLRKNQTAKFITDQFSKGGFIYDRLREGSNMRDQWTFVRSTESVLEGAEKKLAHHEERVKVWKAEAKRLKRKHKVSKKERKERRLSDYSVYNDPGVAEFHAAEDKVQKHENFVEAYKAWVKVLRNENPETPLECQRADLEYFGLV